MKKTISALILFAIFSMLLISQSALFTAKAESAEPDPGWSKYIVPEDSEIRKIIDKDYYDLVYERYLSLTHENAKTMEEFLASYEEGELDLDGVFGPFNGAYFIIIPNAAWGKFFPYREIPVYIWTNGTITYRSLAKRDGIITDDDIDTFEKISDFIYYKGGTIPPTSTAETEPTTSATTATTGTAAATQPSTTPKTGDNDILVIPMIFAASLAAVLFAKKIKE